MSTDLERMREQIAALRRDFDGSFALPARTPGADPLTLLVVRSGGLTQALRIVELVRVESCPELTPLPAQHAAFLGLAALQGRATAVYSLGRLLGRPHVEADARWLLVVQGGLAVAVAAIQGCLRARASDLVREATEDSQPMVALASGHCPVIELGLLVQPLLTPAGRPRTTPQE
jgi:chemotaxis signal transduction protein